MKITEYGKRVKPVKQSEIIAQLQILEVGYRDLNDNLSKFRELDINTDKLSESWAVTKSILNQLRREGVLPRDYVIDDIIEFGIQSGMGVIKGLQDQVKKYKDNVWAGATLTVKQANILNLIDHLEFWLKYSGLVMLVIIDQSTSGKPAESHLTKGDIRWVNGTREFYTDFTKELTRGSRDILTRLEKLPDISNDDDVVDTIEAAHGKQSVSLLKRGFGLHLVNPWFWFESAKANVQLWRIENMRSENVMMAMKINQATNQKNGVNDADLDRRIELLQNEILKNQAKIDAIEASYA